MADSLANTPNSNVAAAATPETDVYFGIVFELDGTEIPLEPTTAIDDIKTKGIECGLKDGERVNIGKVGSRLKTIFETFGVDSSSFLEDDGDFKPEVLPDIEPIKKGVDILTSAELAIEEFHLKIPGTETTDKNKYYTVGLSAVWPGDTGKLIDSIDLKLKGLYFRISNEGSFIL
ncbi:MAG TPA: hypothetical protein V6D26_10375 [Stenomitos sp.]